MLTQKMQKKIARKNLLPKDFNVKTPEIHANI
jgi:hypothetical protein